jgi:DNA-directed RNA polymerase specialized sigma24 family protein
MVKLRPSQQTVRPFKHPLLDTAKDALTEEQIATLLPVAIAGNKEARGELLLGHLSMLRHTIGRYLYHWPSTRKFCDDMVSAGLFAMTRAISKLTENTLGDKPLGQYLLNNACAAIEDEIARLRGSCPAPPSTNRRRVQNGEEPIFGQVETDLEDPDIQDGHSYMESGFDEIDVMDTLEKLRDESDKRALLLKEEYWGLSDLEVSERTGIPRRTVCRYRLELLERYRELTGG